MFYINYIFQNIKIDMSNKLDDNFIFAVNDSLNIKIGLIKLKLEIDSDMYH
jgi:hypothetical protein